MTLYLQLFGKFPTVYKLIRMADPNGRQVPPEWEVLRRGTCLIAGFLGQARLWFWVATSLCHTLAANTFRFDRCPF